MLIYTPGPTEVPPRVLRRMARGITNPDLDYNFPKFYEELQGKLMKVMKTKNDVLVMSGEGFLGLEAAVASLVKRGEKVLAISNGVFGDGFADLVKTYGGVPKLVGGPYDRPVSPEAVSAALDADREIGVATFVHCETPSGVLNPLKEVARVCRDRGVMLVADVVSSLGGVRVEVDEWGVDVALGASQKCFSAPPGLAIVSVSDRAWERVRARRGSIPAYYASLWQWNEWWKKRRQFPYTASISDINALDEALDMLLEEGLSRSFSRHRRISRAVLAGTRAMGLEPYPKDDSYHSPTVTALTKPAGVDADRLMRIMTDRQAVMIAGSWGKLSGKVLRLGNMGYNARPAPTLKALSALGSALKESGYGVKGSGAARAREMLG
ncbi:MAG: alanine--glyoxylate aminotransferase family protein [Nitrososphaerota archaeon]|nr:alanine--glyoxylate aminotransferase family protein [Nitrososphaerota archaeon]